MKPSKIASELAKFRWRKMTKAEVKAHNREVAEKRWARASAEERHRIGLLMAAGRRRKRAAKAASGKK